MIQFLKMCGVSLSAVFLTDFLDPILKTLILLFTAFYGVLKYLNEYHKYTNRKDDKND